MAAIVTGLIPILWTAVDAATTYKCRSLWFGFLSVGLVILSLAELPFTKPEADFTCICSRVCFNRASGASCHLMVTWNFFIYVLVILSILLTELFASHLRSLTQKRSSQGKTDV